MILNKKVSQYSFQPIFKKSLEVEVTLRTVVCLPGNPPEESDFIPTAFPTKSSL